MRLDAAFPDLHLIHLNRQDKLSQAISLARAEQTGLWHVAPDGTEFERLSPGKPPVYDYDLIAKRLSSIERNDAELRAWFSGHPFSHLGISYEGLAAEPSGVVKRVCNFLSVPAPEQDLVPSLAKLADATNQEWRLRFLSERRKSSV